MSDEQVAHEADVPPAGEPIHLPDPSYLPVLLAAGLTVVLVGVVVNVVVLGLGVIFSLVVLIRWIAATRRETAALPLTHDH